ncbi:MarR family transcriptional regulator [bacterium]|nr:MarR family transcriptional regulator [bacterium]
MQKLIKKETQYTDSMFFQIRLTSRYLTLMGNQAFEKLSFPISFEEYMILDTIAYNEGICHRDLAKMLLRDRSNIGKIAASLEQKELIAVIPDIRNNRSIKKLKVTPSGIELCNKMYKKLEPYINILNKELKKEEQEMISKSMEKCRKILDEIVETQI